MFFTINLLTFIYSEAWYNYPYGAVGNHYMFLENSQDVVNVHGAFYQNDNKTDIDKIKISVSISPRMHYHMIDMFKTLKMDIKFSSKLEIQPHGKLDVFLGKYNLLLAPATFISSSLTLLPTYSLYDQIWVKGDIYKESSIYFLHSFDLYLWLAFLTIFLVSIATTLLVKKLSSRAVPAFDIISLILNQGVRVSSSNLWSYKIILFSVSALLILFYGSFEAFLSSLLAIKKSTLPFHDFNSVLEQNEYMLCLRRGTTAYEITKLEKQRNPNFKVKINGDACPYLYTSTDNIINSGTDPVHSICHHDKVVFMSPGKGQEFRLFSRQCRISSINGRYIPQHLSLVVNSGFKYKEQFNIALIHLRTTGVLQNMQLREMLAMNKYYGFDNSYREENGIHPISFQHIHLILFICLGIGICLSLIILLVEIILNRSK